MQYKYFNISAGKDNEGKVENICVSLYTHISGHRVDQNTIGFKEVPWDPSQHPVDRLNNYKEDIIKDLERTINQYKEYFEVRGKIGFQDATLLYQQKMFLNGRIEDERFYSGGSKRDDYYTKDIQTIKRFIHKKRNVKKDFLELLGHLDSYVLLHTDLKGGRSYNIESDEWFQIYNMY